LLVVVVPCHRRSFIMMMAHWSQFSGGANCSHIFLNSRILRFSIEGTVFRVCYDTISYEKSFIGEFSGIMFSSSKSLIRKHTAEIIRLPLTEKDLLT